MSINNPRTLAELTRAVSAHQFQSTHFGIAGTLVTVLGGARVTDESALAETIRRDVAEYRENYMTGGAETRGMREPLPSAVVYYVHTVPGKALGAVRADGQVILGEHMADLTRGQREAVERGLRERAHSSFRWNI